MPCNLTLTHFFFHFQLIAFVILIVGICFATAAPGPQYDFRLVRANPAYLDAGIDLHVAESAYPQHGHGTFKTKTKLIV